MKQFFQSAYGVVAAIAGVVATLWGLCKGIGALRKWIKNALDERKKIREMPMLMLDKIDELEKRFDDIDSQMRTMNSGLAEVKVKLDANDEATATIMLEKMMFAYHTYVLQGEPIPLDVQTALTVMFDEYMKSGMHNHVPSDFKEKIMACQIKGVTTNTVS